MEITIKEGDVISKEQYGNIGLGTTTPNKFLSIRMTKKDFRRYSLRIRMGIHILRFMGVASLEIIK